MRYYPFPFIPHSVPPQVLHRIIGVFLSTSQVNGDQRYYLRTYFGPTFAIYREIFGPAFSVQCIHAHTYWFDSGMHDVECTYFTLSKLVTQEAMFASGIPL